MTTGDSLGGAERGRNSPGAGSSPALPTLRRRLRLLDRRCTKLLSWIPRTCSLTQERLVIQYHRFDKERRDIRNQIKSRSIPKEYQ